MNYFFKLLPVLALTLTATHAIHHQEAPTSNHKFGKYEVFKTTGKNRNAFNGRKALLRKKTKHRQENTRTH